MVADGRTRQRCDRNMFLSCQDQKALLGITSDHPLMILVHHIAERQMAAMQAASMQSASPIVHMQGASRAVKIAFLRSTAMMSRVRMTCNGRRHDLLYKLETHFMQIPLFQAPLL